MTDRRRDGPRLITAAPPVVAVVALVVLALGLRADPAPWIDLRARAWAKNHRNDAAFTFLDTVKDVGNPALALPVLACVAVVIAIRLSTWTPLATTLLAAVGMALVTSAVKTLVARPGPSGVGPPAVDGAWPSGHALTMAVACFLLAAILPAGRSRWVLVPATLVSVVGAAGLVYCGHHWLTDVLVAVPLGYLLVTVAEAVTRRLWPDSSQQHATSDDLLRPAAAR